MRDVFVSDRRGNHSVMLGDQHLQPKFEFPLDDGSEDTAPEPLN